MYLPKNFPPTLYCPHSELFSINYTRDIKADSYCYESGFIFTIKKNNQNELGSHKIARIDSLFWFL